jgi:hypothetical protein
MAALVGGCGSDKVTDAGGGGGGGAGGGLTVMGAVYADEDSYPAGPHWVVVVVANNGQIVGNANVSVNGVGLQYYSEPEEYSVYYAEVSLSPGQVATLTVTSPYGNRTLSATMPGSFEITSPLGGASFPGNADIPVAWTPAANAEQYAVNYYSDDVYPMHWGTVPGGTLAYLIPGSATTPEGDEIGVYAMNGEGDPFRFPYDLWSTRTGFWAMYQDYVDIQVR